jgi:hypothetical protein
MTVHYKPLYIPPKTSFGFQKKMGGPDVRPVPLGISDFEQIIKGHYLYIDKTSLIRHMINNKKFCFLYRPRRFGKTLLLDTLRHLFRGDKELFENLWIGQKKFEWRNHPVIDLDLKVEDPHLLTAKSFREIILGQLRQCALDYDLKLRGTSPSVALNGLVDSLYNKHSCGVVILVDNYDCPLTGQFLSPDQGIKIKKILSNLLSKLFPIRICLRFVLITGQFRFPDRSLYTPMPRPFDLSFNKLFASLCGVTSYELDKHCYEHMKSATAELKDKGLFEENKTILDFRRALLYNYNGYCFDGETRVINPHTLMHVLKYQTFDDEAYNLDMPVKQIEVIKKNNLTFELQSSHHYVTRTGNAISLDDLPVLPYLLQSGYLTLRRIRPMKGQTHLLLRITNHEIRRKLYLHLLSDGRNKELFEILRGRMAIIYKSLQSLSIQAIETSFRLLLTSLRKPMNISEQDYFNNDLYLAMRMLFQPMDLDDPRQDGVIDGAIDFVGGNIFIVELRSADRAWITLEHEPFKNEDPRKILPPWRLPKTTRTLESAERFEPFWAALHTFLDLEAQLAIQTIEEKQYPERFFPYITDTTKVYKVGVAVYQREKVRVIVEQADRPTGRKFNPFKVPA